MPFDYQTVMNALDEHGHLHLHLDSGEEYGVSLGDTTVATNHKESKVVIDSDRGKWTFPIDKIEQIDWEPSGPVK